MSFQLKILSYNIHKGFSLGNWKFVLGQMRQAIREIHPDLVFLQEVMGMHRRHRNRIADWPNTTQFEYLAGELWPHYAYGKNAVYSSGDHGNAILSKFPFLEWENLDISTNRLERRGMLHAVIDIPGQRHFLHVITLHLDLLKKGRNKQVEDLCRRIEDHVPHQAPLIICGDFNDWSLRVSRILERRLEVQEAHYDVHDHHARTFPSIMPVLKLDRVYIRGLSAQDARALSGHPWRTLSDHAAIYAELKFPLALTSSHR
jgi:endonuclease/exonuclease/phosphatase family metal-dependent hydrolase